ncbi:hypothetical protein [Streptomyces sp. NPDC004728]|uniref:hypothetical protein n=1 Tax=Streptomyces sp. NPDC004728 TaxID=3154289 RepID=UPI0033B8123E
MVTAIGDPSFDIDIEPNALLRADGRHLPARPRTRLHHPPLTRDFCSGAGGFRPVSRE